MVERNSDAQQMLDPRYAHDPLYILMNTPGISSEAVVLAAEDLVREQNKRMEIEIREVQGSGYLSPAPRR